MASYSRMPKSRRPNRRRLRLTRKMRGGSSEEEEGLMADLLAVWFEITGYYVSSTEGHLEEEIEIEVTNGTLSEELKASVLEARYNLEAACALRELGPYEETVENNNAAEFVVTSPPIQKPQELAGGAITKGPLGLAKAAMSAATKVATNAATKTQRRGLLASVASKAPLTYKRTFFAPQPLTFDPTGFSKLTREQLKNLQSELNKGPTKFNNYKQNIVIKRENVTRRLNLIAEGAKPEEAIEGLSISLKGEGFPEDIAHRELLNLDGMWTEYGSLLEELNRVRRQSRSPTPMSPITLWKNLGKKTFGGARGTLQGFFRNFTGSKRGEHALPVVSFVRSTIYAAWQNQYPTFTEFSVMTTAIKNMVRPEILAANLLLDRLLKAAEKIKSQPNFETRLEQAYNALKPEDKTIIDSIGSSRKNAARGLEAVHKYREEAVEQTIDYVTKSKPYQEDSSYLKPFLDEVIRDFPVRTKAPQSAYVPSGRKFGDQRRHFSTSSRRPPADARLTLEEFDKLNTGPDLKSKVPKEVLEQLGLTAERIRIPILKDKVFKYLFAEDKLRGQMEHIQLAKVRYEIASAALSKNTPLIAQLRQVEAELMERVGASKPMTRLSAANTSVSLGPNSPMMEEGAQISGELMAADSARKASLESLVSSTTSSIESSADKALIDEVLIKPDEPSDPMQKAAASYATVSALADKAFIGGARLPTTLANKTDVIRVENINNATKEAADLYSEITGSGLKTPIPTPEQAAIEYSKISKPLPPPVENATSLLEQVKAYTPYGQALRKLTENITITKPNVSRFEIIAKNIAHEGRAIKNYNKLINEGLNVVLANAEKKQIDNLLKVFTPQRMFDFKTTMVSLFSYSVTDATIVFNATLTHIIPKSRYHAAQIDEFLLRIRLNPAEAVSELQKLSMLTTGETVKILSASEQAKEKGMGWFASKGFYTLLFGVGGGSVLFLANYMNTPDMASFAAKASNVKANVSNSLLKNPTYQSVAEAGRELRDRILVDVLKQTPPPAVIEKQAPSWSKSIMWSLGYNPEVAEDRRKFGELGNSVRDVAGKAAVTAVLAGAGAIGVAVVKALLSR